MNALTELLIINRVILLIKQLTEEQIDIIINYAPLIKDNLFFVSNRLDYLYRNISEFLCVKMKIVTFVYRICCDCILRN